MNGKVALILSAVTNLKLSASCSLQLIITRAWTGCLQRRTTTQDLATIPIGISYFLSDRAKVSTELWFTSEGFQEIGKTLLNVSISVIYFGIVGMVLGLLLRSPISAISIGVLWLLIIENLIGAVKPVTLEWMPGNQLSTIAQGGSPELAYSHALILGSSYVFVGAIVATVLFSRRDVAN